MLVTATSRDTRRIELPFKRIAEVAYRDTTSADKLRHANHKRLED